MIEKPEIDAKAEELGVHAANVQRDYVFGWLLSSVYRADIHVSLLSRENTGAQARSGERAPFGCRTAQLAFCLSAVVPALRRTRHPFAVSGPKAVTED